jgi:hypothetical protein
LSLAWFVRWFSRPVNGASLAVFRIAVGLLMALEAYSLVTPAESTFGAIPLEAFYTGSDIGFRVPYEGFGWLPLLPPLGFKILVGVLAVSGISMALGFLYRVSSTLVFLSWGYFYAIEATRTYWMSYYYLELITTFLMIWMPAARRFSIDAVRSGERVTTVPLWTLILLRGQLVITYFYAGLAKISTDWLLDAEPVRYYLSKARILPEIRPLLSRREFEWLASVIHSDATAYFISWVGALFDLSVGFLLLFRRTRALGMVLMFIFHGINHFLLFADIDWFPLVGVTTAFIFLEAEWPERFGRWLLRPRIPKPDWGYFWGGFVLLPVVGGFLGWKGARRAPVTVSQVREPVRWAVPLVLGWLVFQTLNPLRHYFLSVDSRFTREQLAFSWRLKAEVYRTEACKLYLGDTNVIRDIGGGRTEIRWAQWHGEKAFYREVSAGPTDWSQLPELLVFLEPRVGERILFNPYSGTATAKTEVEARQRITDLWKSRYGHVPTAMHRTAPIAQIVSAYGSTLKSRGQEPRTLAETAEIFKSAVLNDTKGELTPVLRRLNPLEWEGETAPGPFILVEDPALYQERKPGETMRVKREVWVSGPECRVATDSRIDQVGGDGMIVYCSHVAMESPKLFPQAYIVDGSNSGKSAFKIRWNYALQLAPQMQMHVSSNPFILRRFSRSVADLWAREYQRRPSVSAETHVSFNGRPYQALVDTNADLASVSRVWFGHNSWIRDLEFPRVPPGGIVPK